MDLMSVCGGLRARLGATVWSVTCCCSLHDPDWLSSLRRLVDVELIGSSPIFRAVLHRFLDMLAWDFHRLKVCRRESDAGTVERKRDC